MSDIEKEKVSSAGEVSISLSKRTRKAPKVVNQELLEMTREADMKGFGVSYGKYVQKKGL